MANTKNIIFDLGGVLLNINYNKTISAFNELGVEKFEEMYNQFQANEIFIKLETGKISNNEFYDEVKKIIPNPVHHQQIEKAWNAMLLNFRTESLVTLEKISQKYSLYLLSNTNTIHLECFHGIFTRDTGKPSLDSYFSKCWYSNELGMRKPDKEIYEFVLQDENLNAEETLFIDDTPDNLEAAKLLGIKTHLLMPNEKIEDLF